MKAASLTAVPFAAVLAIGLSFAGAALAEPPAPPSAAAPAKFGPQSTFAELMANPKSKAMLYERIPFVMQVLDMGLFPDNRTLQIVAEDEQAQTMGGFTPAVYQQMLKDLAAL